ncbi:hypothetical protein ABFP28_03380 [Acinetobacter baumannii]|uniref:acyl-CoA thioesterase n=1 Tax=Acinetobacter baumannii TaxID=470 RepID=UPI00321419BE
MLSPVYPSPDSLQLEQHHKLQVIEQVPDNYKSIFMQPFQLEIKPIEFLGFKAESKSSSYAEYFRTYDKLILNIDSVILHQAIMAYYSDYNLLSISLLNHGISYFDDKIKAISLDHIIFFHHDFRVDEWSLYDLSTNISSQARSLNYGKVWQNNKLVCSTVQECLLRTI